LPREQKKPPKKKKAIQKPLDQLKPTEDDLSFDSQQLNSQVRERQLNTQVQEMEAKAREMLRKTAPLFVQDHGLKRHRNLSQADSLCLTPHLPNQRRQKSLSPARESEASPKCVKIDLELP